MPPLVSIIIPVYNGSNFLKEAIDSALNQTYKNIEVIVVNDGSNDNGATEAIAKSYKNKIRYFSKPNGGVSTALNLGIKKMKGEYFSWLSHDDLYYPNKIERQMKEYNKFNRDDYIIASNIEVLFENGLTNKIKIHKPTFKHFRIFLATSAKVGLNGCSLLIPKKAFEEEEFDPKRKFTQDYDLWFRLANKFEFCLVDECLVTSRRHNNQDSASKANKFKKEADKLHFDIINQLCESEFDYYFNKIINFKHCYKNLKVYLRNSYNRTSSILLKKMLNYSYKYRRICFYWLFLKLGLSPFGTKKHYTQSFNTKWIDHTIGKIVKMHNKSNQSKNSCVKKIRNGVEGDGLMFTLKRLFKKIIDKLN